MKIAFVLPSLSDSSPIKLTNKIIAYLHGQGAEIDIYYFDVKNYEIDFIVKPIKINFFEVFNFDYYDIIHSVMFRPDLYIRFHKRKILKAKCISSIHQYIQDNLFYSYGKFISLIFTPIWYFSLNSFDLVILLSDDMKRYYSSKIKTKLFMINNGLKVQQDFHLESSFVDKITLFKSHYKLIVCIGGLTDTKGFDQIIKTMPELTNCKLLIIGDGKNRKKLEHLALSMGIKDKVMFLGYISDAYKIHYFTDICLIPSRSEGFPLVLLEAVALKKKVICSNLAVFSEIFNDDEVYKFKLNNLNDLKSKIEFGIKHDNTEKAYKKYISSYTEEVMVENYYQLYRKLMNA